MVSLNEWSGVFSSTSHQQLGHRDCGLIGTTSENLFIPYANNKEADQPARSRSLISAFVICCLDSIRSVKS